MTENNQTDIFSMPYAKWLEKTLQDIMQYPVKGIVINSVSEDGDIYTNYYNVSMLNKITIAGILQQDAMYDSLAATGAIEYEEDDDEEGESYGEEKE